MPALHPVPNPCNDDVYPEAWHGVVTIAIDTNTPAIRYSIASYADLASAYSGKKPIAAPREHILSGEAYDAFVASHQTLMGLMIEAADELLLAMPEFAGALQVAAGPPSPDAPDPTPES